MKKLVSIVALCMMMTAMFSAQVFAEIPSSNDYPESTVASEAITPRKDSIVWKYKVIDGRVYHRLYNETKNIWYGEWEAM